MITDKKIAKETPSQIFQIPVGTCLKPNNSIMYNTTLVQSPEENHTVPSLYHMKRKGCLTAE